MKAALSISALCFVAACGGPGGSTTSLSTSTAPTAIEDLPQIAVSDAPSATFESMLNGVRSANGVGSVSYNTRLGAAARRHANDLAENMIWSHTGSDGSKIGDRVRDAGYSYSWVGENIARGQSNEQQALDGWMNSTTGHRENNLKPRAEHFALAKADGALGRYWVLVLADPL